MAAAVVLAYVTAVCSASRRYCVSHVLFANWVARLCSLLVLRCLQRGSPCNYCSVLTDSGVCDCPCMCLHSYCDVLDKVRTASSDTTA